MTLQNTFKGYRMDFPFFKKRGDLIYLDTAATAQKPKRVIEAMSEFYNESYATVHRALYQLSKDATEEYSSVRDKVKNFIGASSSSEIVFTKSATAAINLVARSLAKSILKKGSRILISEIEHHSNLIPWQMVAEEYGMELSFIPMNDEGEILFSEYEKELLQGVHIVAIAEMSNSLGVIHPIREMAKLAKANGALFLVDAAQSVSHVEIDVKMSDVDFLVFSGHKLYGPTGIGILYGKRELLEKMAPIEGGGDMVDQVSLEKSTYAEIPLKFEAGTPMIVEVIGLGHAVDYISSIGLGNISEWEGELHSYLEKQLCEINKLRIFGNAKRKGPLTSFLIEGIHPMDLGLLLEAKGVCVRTGHLCSQPTMKRIGVSSVLRASLGLYSSYEDVDRFITALEESIKIL